jgi:hypothetical protein
MFEKARSAVDDALGGLPPEGIRYYGNEIEAMGNLIASQERVAVSAESVAKIVEHALIARRPRTRYLVGRDAKLMAFFPLAATRSRFRWPAGDDHAATRARA